MNKILNFQRISCPVRKRNLFTWIIAPLLILFLSTGQLLAQLNTYKGVVKSSNGELLPGVNVSVKGTTIGSITDINGIFQFSYNQPTATINVSFIGYKSQEVNATSSSTTSITLIEDVLGLDEVIVVGYGVQKKSLVTGAISSIKSEDIQNTPVSRAEQALQGKTAGVMVLPSSGSPGAAMKVRIRGAGTNGNANPLYIVDGIKVADINSLDPNDIQNVEVLKDAASSAIYGAEGGNGVVIITTKVGKSGEGSVNYSFQYGIQSPGKLPELMSAEQYSQYMSEGKLLTIDPTAYKGKDGTDWLGEIFSTAPMQKHNLSFSGGSDKGSYLASASYFNQDGMIGGDKSKFERITTRINIDQNVKSWLKVGAKISYSNTKRASIGEDDEFDGVLSGALMIDPITPAIYSGELPQHIKELVAAGSPLRKNSDGKYFGISQYIQGEAVNPLIRLDISNGQQVTNELMGNFSLDISLMKGLTFTSRVGIDYAHQATHSWFPTYYYSSERQNLATSVRERTFTKQFWQWENFASYNKSFGQSNLTVVAGTSAEQLLYSTLNADKGPMSSESELFAQFDYTTSTTGTVSGKLYEEKLLSYFGRASYDYKNRYMLEATMRYDGASTSLLHPDHNWGVFPSISAGWVISEESFFPKTVVNYMKVRGSWGQNGSLANLKSAWKVYDDFSPYNGISQFAYLAAVTSTNIRYPLPGGGYITGSEPDVLSNNNLTWETSQQTDFGIDIKALDGKVSLSVDYFNKQTKDLLAIYDAPATAGNDPPFVNTGDVVNKGFEFDLGFHQSKGDFKYDINMNFSTLKNEVTKLNADVPRIPGMRVGPGWEGATAFEVGQPIWYFRGYETNGVDKVTGEPIFVDHDGKPGITEDDKTNIGSPHPKYVYGANFSLNYKDFDFGLFVQGVGGNDILMGWIRTDRATCNKPTLFYDGRWTPSNTNASMPKAGCDANAFRSDLMISSGAYMRIKQIQFGYNLPKSILSKVKIGKARVYVSFDDYFTFTKYKGMDPEAGSDEDSSLGIDRGVYPMPRKVMFGLNVTF